MQHRLTARRTTPRHRLTLGPAMALLLAGPFLASAPAHANNYGESASWQFETPSDIAAQAAARDLIERRRGGVFAAPIYNTHVDRQYVCSVSASATGNNGVQSAVANSPGITGATSNATGNASQSSLGDGDGDPRIDGQQSNSGAVSAGVIGSTNAAVHGTASQALNSDQANSGDQSASVRGSNACAFGVLN